MKNSKLNVAFVDYKFPDKKVFGQNRHFITFQISRQQDSFLNFKIFSPEPLGYTFFNKFKGIVSSESSEIDLSISKPKFIKFPTNFLTPLLLKFQLNNLSNSILNEFKSSRKLDNINLIHSHFGMFGASTIKLKNFLNIPQVTTFYGHDVTMLPKKIPGIYDILARESDLNLALSSDMKNDLLNLGFNNVKVWRLGVDTAFFHPSNKKSSDLFKVITVARFSEKKGIEYSIKAFSNFLDYNMNAEYLILGYGKLKETYEKLIKKLGIEDKVKLINNLEQEDPRKFVREQLQKSDVFLLPSITSDNGDKEGTPVVLMEAQACGLPCISSKHAGIPEVVLDGKTGFLAEEKNSKEITQFLIKLFDNKQLRMKFSKESRNHILDNYNCDKQASILSNHYKEIIQ